LRLLRLLHEFNDGPAGYLDPSRREQLCPGTPGRVWDSARARPHLSRHILGALALPACLEAQRPEWPLALLEPARLRHLAVHIAAAAVSAQVRGSLLRDEVVAWRAWLSPGPFAFAQRTAGLLPLKVPPQAVPDRSISAESAGLRWLARAALAWPAAVAGRFLLKMPCADAEHPCAADEPVAARLASAVLSIVEPRWCSSLATIRT
jgi:hypothetical protein